MFRLCLLVGVLVMMGGALPAPVNAQGGGNRAALVVRYGDGTVHPKCVAFSESAITGDELLQRSGLAVILNYSSGGGAVCSINGYGCAYPSQDCFCKCVGQGASCQYWAYYHWIGGAWQYSQVGASGYQVRNGALEGWSWGPGNFSSGTIPPAVTFDEICAPATATPTPTRTSTPTPTPGPTSTATATPSPTATPGSTGQGAITSSGRLPEMQFETAATTLAPGACTVLHWVIWDAQQVTLDGAAVAAQDRREVCLQTTQRFILTATNAAGQARQELTITVIGAAGQTPTLTPQPSPTLRVGATPSPTLTAPPARGGAAPVAAPRAATPVAQGQAPAAEGLSVVPVAHAQAAPPVETQVPSRAAAAPGAPPAKTSSIPALPPTRAVARRPIAAGQPTATPILVARLKAEDGANRSESAAPSPSERAATSLDRGFRMSFLPGYAIYSLMAAMLVGVGAVVMRRRRV